MLNTGSVFLLVSSSDYDPSSVKYVGNPDKGTKGCYRGRFTKICEKTRVLRRSGECVIAVRSFSGERGLFKLSTSCDSLSVAPAERLPCMGTGILILFFPNRIYPLNL